MARLRLKRLRERPINASPSAPEQKSGEPDSGSDSPGASKAAGPKTAVATPPRPNGNGASARPGPAVTIPRPQPAPPPPPPPLDPELEDFDEWRPWIPLPLKILLGVLALGAIVAFFLGAFDSGEETTPPAPRIGGGAASGNATADDLGFPVFATQNTTRIGGSSAAANAAAAALASFPSTVEADSPSAVTFVGESDWQGAIAAASLVADPVRAPILFSGPDGVPPETEQAMSVLEPQGTAATGESEAFALPGTDVPEGLDPTRVGGKNPASVAAGIAALREKLVGLPPEHIVVVSSERASFAMPAAAWAARSGDPILFSGRDRLPEETAKVIAANPGTPVYVLGPPAAISKSVFGEISEKAGQATRVFREDPVANSIELARYGDGTFGWNINDPGHGFVVARSDRPLDAAAAAPLASGGTWGPLLLTDNAATLPGPLRGYLLDVKPGYASDPTRAFYNHVWLIGDRSAIDLGQQAAIDFAAELTRIEPNGTAGSGVQP